MKRYKTIDLIGCSLTFSEIWIHFHIYGNMAIENFCRVRNIDHCHHLYKTDLSNKI